MSDQTFSIDDLLGLLADDIGRAEPNDDARNVAAAALVAAFTGPLEEFSVRRAILLPNWQQLEARARETANGDLPVEGRITKKPWLALCARVLEFGFGNADVATGHRFLFAMLVELLCRMPESSRRTLATVASGLRVLIERHDNDPVARPQSPISSAWGLFSWIEGHTQLKQYIKVAWSKCAAAAANALVTSDLAWGTNAGEDEAALEPTSLGVLEGIDIWQIPLASGSYEFELPDEVEQTCLAKCLTRVASLSRFAVASPLRATNGEMQGEVAALLRLASSSDPASAQCRRAVASLLSIGWALLFHALRRAGREPDLMKIWERQEADENLMKVFTRAAALAQKAILDPPVGSANVGEWSKKEECWEKVKAINFRLDASALEWSIDKDESKSEVKQARQQGVQDDGISLQQQIWSKSENGYWQALLEWERVGEHVFGPELDLLRRAASPLTVAKLATERDWKRLRDIGDRCESEGFRQN